jgi:hypothetical protein
MSYLILSASVAPCYLKGKYEDENKDLRQSGKKCLFFGVKSEEIFCFSNPNIIKVSCASRMRLASQVMVSP